MFGPGGVDDIQNPRQAFFLLVECLLLHPKVKVSCWSFSHIKCCYEPLDEGEGEQKLCVGGRLGGVDEEEVGCVAWMKAEECRGLFPECFGRGPQPVGEEPALSQEA